MVDRRRNRLLKDIDSALNQSNHDLLLIPSKTEEIGVELEKNKKYFLGNPKAQFVWKAMSGEWYFQAFKSQTRIQKS